MLQHKSRQTSNKAKALGVLCPAFCMLQHTIRKIVEGLPHAAALLSALAPPDGTDDTLHCLEAPTPSVSVQMPLCIYATASCMPVACPGS